MLKPKDFSTMGEYLRALVAEKGMSMKKAAETMGIHYTSFHKICINKFWVNAAYALIIERHFNAKAIDILYRVAELQLEKEKKYIDWIKCDNRKRSRSS